IKQLDLFIYKLNINSCPKSFSVDFFFYSCPTNYKKLFKYFVFGSKLLAVIYKIHNRIKCIFNTVTGIELYILDNFFVLIVRERKIIFDRVRVTYDSNKRSVDGNIPNRFFKK